MQNAQQEKQLSALAGQITIACRSVFRSQKKALEAARQAGDYLIQVKEILGHGNLKAWVATNCGGVKARQAQRYMKLARNWKEITANASYKSYLTIEMALKLISQDDVQEGNENSGNLDDTAMPGVDESPVETTGTMIPTNRRTIRHNNPGDRDAAGEPQSESDLIDNDSGDSISSSDAESVATGTMIPRSRRTDLFERVINGQCDADNPARLAVDKVFPKFHEDVLKLARKLGRSSCNRAVQAMGGDELLMAKLLLHRLQKQLDPQAAYAPLPALELATV